MASYFERTCKDRDIMGNPVFHGNCFSEIPACVEVGDKFWFGRAFEIVSKWESPDGGIYIEIEHIYVDKPNRTEQIEYGREVEVEVKEQPIYPTYSFKFARSVKEHFNTRALNIIRRNIYKEYPSCPVDNQHVYVEYGFSDAQVCLRYWNGYMIFVNTIGSS